jgi:ribosome-binding factor A
MAHRIERVNALIRKEVSELIQHHLRDPRLDSFVAVTEVVTSPDLQHARIFISGIGGKQEKEKIMEVLGSAAGFLRTELAGRVRLRHIPELVFAWDDSIEHGDHILRLIDEVNAEREP